MENIENDKKIFYRLEDAQDYYMHYIEFWNDETVLECDYIQDEAYYEFCGYCQKCLSKNKKRKIKQNKGEKFDALKQITLYTLENNSDDLIERQKNIKSVKILASIACRYDRTEGRKLKQYLKDYHYILWQRLV